jgi:eukaryotic translation initiation factor 2C
MSEPVEVPNWLVIIYESQGRFNPHSVERMIVDFVRGCVAVGKTFQASSTGHHHTKDLIGIRINPKPALKRWESGQGVIAHVSRLAAYLVDSQPLSQQLSDACEECLRNAKAVPTLIVAVLPDGGNHIYTAIKK